MAQIDITIGQRLRRAMLGAPIPTSKAHHERLSPFLGLPVFSSDALSSVAYATEAILLILVYLSASMLREQIWISLAIVTLIVVVSISYRQTIHAYPSGGGSYIVASDNLGHKPGLVAAGALLIDYVLTVAVSIAAGVAAILSAFPQIRTHVPDAQITLSIACIAIVAFANLRGLRESGTLFAIPTYGFVLAMAALIGWGFYRITHTPIIPMHVETNLLGKEASAGRLFILLRAFAAGCTALTGIEAVSNGVQAFRVPESRNAAKTLAMMSTLLAFLFLGTGYLALHLPEHYAHFSIYESSDHRYLTLTSQIAAFAFGPSSGGFYAVQILTALILILAANTAFADFPRLASLIARDGYLPRYLARLGDKLVFHNGIMLLAAAAALLVFVFKGQLDSLLPLYAVGVFTAFTLSQTGMVVHWSRLRSDGWQRSAAINAVGALLCGVVLIIIAVTKFREGAWLVLVLLPIFYSLFQFVRHRYDSTNAQLAISSDEPMTTKTGEQTVLLLVPRVNRGTLQALEFARQLKGTVEAVHVAINEKALPDLQRKWDQVGSDVPMVVLPSPYRSLIQPILDYVDELRATRSDGFITVIVAEAVSHKWYHPLLTENVAQQLKNSLAKRNNVVVANVRYFLS